MHLAVLRGTPRGQSLTPRCRRGSNVMAATMMRLAAPASAAKPWYKVLYVQVLIAIVLGVLVGWLWPDVADQRLDQGAGRRLHQADQDGHRADHLLHRGVGHRAHPGRQEGRPRRRQGADLFRDRLDLRAGDRASSSAISCGRARASAAPRPTRSRSPATPSRPRRRRPSTSSCTSFPTPWSAPSRRAKSCRCCSSRSCSASR